MYVLQDHVREAYLVLFSSLLFIASAAQAEWAGVKATTGALIIRIGLFQTGSIIGLYKGSLRVL